MAKNYMDMTDAEQRAEAIRLAEKTVTLTVEEAKKLPNLLGVLVSKMLAYRGWDSHRVCGVNTFYRLPS